MVPKETGARDLFEVPQAATNTKQPFARAANADKEESRCRRNQSGTARLAVLWLRKSIAGVGLECLVTLRLWGTL